jgi:small GTP-binding protein
MKSVKVVVLGLAAVGKSALSIRFIQNSFVKDYEPTISNNYTKTVNIDHNTYSVDILDTAGMEGGETLKPNVFRSRDCFVLVYDITDRASFENVPQIHEDILRIRDAKSVPCCLIGNKCDLVDDREVQTEEGQQLAKNIGAIFYETSAKSGINVVDAIEGTIREYIKTIPAPTKKSGWSCLLV